MLEIRGIWLCHMSRWDRYVLRPRVRAEMSGSEKVPHIGPYTMCREIINKRLHTFPSLGNVFIIQLSTIHNVTSQLDNFSRWVVLPNKSILALIPRIYAIPRQSMKPNFSSFP